MTITDLHSNRAHVRHGLKTGIAAVLAYALTEALGLRMGFWAVLSAVIVMQVNVADSISMSLYRFSGTAVGALIGLAALLLFPGDSLFQALALFVCVAFCAYMTRYNVRYKMAAITVVIVLLAGTGEEHPLMFSIYRILEIGIGVGCAVLVSVALWPARAGASLRARLEAHFLRCADTYDTLVEAFLSKQQQLPADLLQALNREIAENRVLLRKALQHERLLFDDDTALLTRQVEMLERCMDHMHAMLHAVNTAEGEGFTLIMEEELRNLARAGEEAMRALGRGQQPDAPTLRQVLAASEKRLLELREEGKTRRFNLRKLLQIMAFLNSIQALAEELLRGSAPLAGRG